MSMIIMMQISCAVGVTMHIALLPTSYTTVATVYSTNVVLNLYTYGTIAKKIIYMRKGANIQYNN
jgi:hypothetical protein